MYKSDQARKKTAQKRAIKRGIKAGRLPNGAHATRKTYVSGEGSHRHRLRDQIKGGDRRAVHMQLHAACRGDLDMEVTGKGLPANLIATTAMLTS